MKTYQLSVNGYENLLGKLGDLNKRADKLGVGYVTTSVLRKFTEITTDGTGNERIVSKVEFTLDGEKPTVNGYKMVAVLENVNGENIIRFLAGEDDEFHEVQEYRRRVECDHCDHNRKRKHTYILQNEITGEYLQVGKTCLKDFLEGDITYLIKFAELDMVKIEEEAKGTREAKDKEFVGVVEYVALAIEYIREQGYRKAHTFGSTATRVWDNFFVESVRRRNFRLVDTIEKNREEAVKIVEWAKEQTGAEKTYLYNLSVIAKDGDVTFTRTGLAASMPIAYRRAQELLSGTKDKKVEETRKPLGATWKVSEYVGTVGAKFRFEGVRVEAVTAVNGRYGVSDMVLLRSQSGDVLKWFTTVNHKLRVGDVMSVEGVIKAHSEYRGTKQTTLTYVKKIDESLGVQAGW